MDDRIVDQVLRASPRLLAQWRAAVSARGAEFDDLLAEGSLDAVIGVADLGAEVDGFLQRCGQVPAAHLRLMPPDVVR
jgi:hypothetical protein